MSGTEFGLKPTAYESGQQGAVTTARIDYSGGNTEHLLFVTSDLHVDSVDCNRDWLLADLKEAKERGAIIMLFGDVFDAMQGRFDPRRSLDELRPEYRRQDYYDFVVKDVARILSPFAENIMLIAPGNHESAVLKNASISLIDRLVYCLNMEHGGKVLQGGYGGWVRFLLSRKTTGGRLSVKLKYHHGFGGDAPVTKGVIHTNRQNVYIKDADIILNGHNHNAYYVPIVSESITDSGKIVFHTTHHLRTPGYKQDYGDGGNGWAVEKGMVPKPLGGAFIKLKVCNKGAEVKNMICQISVQPVIHAPEVV
jgi:hypothetical protein